VLVYSARLIAQFSAMRALAIVLVLIASVLHARADAPCPRLAMAPVAVPHLRDAVRNGDPLVIVALGSSSTWSFMASNRAHSYPAVLQQMLSAALPQAHVSVLDRGVNGQDAAEEVTRLDGDVIAVRPQAVIWQVGANGALRNSDPATFKRLVSAGVGRLHEAGIDVVLMDNQRSPRILAAPDHVMIDQALADVAVATNASLFSRSALFDAWRNQGIPYRAFISPDGLHQNDLGYRCVAEALAHSIIDGIGPQPEPQAQALAQTLIQRR
jgi:acyl-CoA thioesterase I